MDSLTFLERLGKAKPLPVYAVTGDEDFLKRQVVAALKKLVLGDADESFCLSVYAGDKVDLAAVRDDLATLPFLGPRRLVIIENADPFVTAYRAALEKYVAQPSATGVLVLDVKSWPSNTRLAKLLGDAATITCKAPTAAKLAQWCVQWAQTQHGKQLSSSAAQLLVDLVGLEMGLLDQEISKLAVYAGNASRIDVRDVDTMVGRSREAETFKIFDAIGKGHAGEALAILDQLFDQGHDALKVLGAFSWQLRPLAQAARLCQQGLSIPAALARVGVPEWKARECEQQLRHLGSRRTDRLFEWLLEADLGMKGSSALPPRIQLERLIVRLARPRQN